VLRRVTAIQALAAAALLLFCGQARAPDLNAAPPVSASVSAAPAGRPMPPGFVGVSVEYNALRAYTGRDPRAIDLAFVGLLRGLAPGQAPVLRIGGDSTDFTWWPVRGMIPRGGITYSLTKAWLSTTRALAGTLGARLIMGINLASDRVAVAAAEARAIVSGIGRSRIDALEIGNEPDLYGVIPWYVNARGRGVLARPRHYGMSGFIRDFSHWRAAIPALPLVGPSVSSLGWLTRLRDFLGKERAVRQVTAHRYPLHNSTTDPAMPSYPSIPNLLSDASSSGIAQELAPYVTIAHSRGLAFRVDEMNSVSGGGRRGVSDTFASALWILDALFDMASVSVDGVNVHTLPGAGYELFTFSQSGAFVHPEYYGMMMFARAFPPGARLLPVSAPSGPLKVWATSGSDGTIRVVLINKDPTTPASVQLRLPGTQTPATVERLSAPSVDATSGVTLAGQTFGSQTTTGTLPGAPITEPAAPLLGTYTVDVPAGSAALVVK
jgi:hypothetical protein